MGIAGSYSHDPAGRRRTRIEGAPPVIFGVATVASVTRDAWTQMRKVSTTGHPSGREQVGLPDPCAYNSSRLASLARIGSCSDRAGMTSIFADGLSWRSLPAQGRSPRAP